MASESALITGHTAVYGLVGHPIAHSPSPRLHNAWFRHHNIDAVYVACPTTPGQGPVAAALHTLGFSGANLTIPHKTDVFSACERVDAAATASRAVNTVVRRDGRLTGYNTDVSGFTAAIAEIGLDLHGAVIRILGAGGAAAAVAVAALNAGASRVFFLNRSRDRATRLIEHLGSRTRYEELGARHLISPTTDVVVNTLPRAGRPLVTQIQTHALTPSTTWIDLNYWDRAPPHLADLAERGHGVQTGHAMLLHQAAHAFERFVNVTPDLALVRDYVTQQTIAMAGPMSPR